MNAFSLVVDDRPSQNCSSMGCHCLSSSLIVAQALHEMEDQQRKSEAVNKPVAMGVMRMKG